MFDVVFVAMVSITGRLGNGENWNTKDLFVKTSGGPFCHVVKGGCGGGGGEKGW